MRVLMISPYSQPVWYVIERLEITLNAIQCCDTVLRRSNKHVSVPSSGDDSIANLTFLRPFSGNAHVIAAFNENFGVTDNNKWTIALSIFYVGYCELLLTRTLASRHSDGLSTGLLEMPANGRCRSRRFLAGLLM